MDIKNLYSKKIESTSVYTSSKQNEIEEKEILDFSKEKNDINIDEMILESICDEIRNKACCDELEFNKACSAYLKVEQFVDADFKNEISICDDIKEVMNILLLSFINKDDCVLIDSFKDKKILNMNKWLEGKVYEYKLNKFDNYLIDFESIDEDVLKRCKILFLNYPNSVTGKVANKAFFKEVIKYAKKYNFIVINDATYIDLCFDKLDQVSFLSVEGAKEVGVEVHSFSQNFNMHKYNMGFIAGNRDIIKMYNKIKDEIGWKKEYLFEKTLSLALNNYERILLESKNMYLRRHSLLKEALENNGIKSEVPKSGICQYIEVPRSCNGVTFENASEFSSWLEKNENILVVPCDKNEKYIKMYLNIGINDEEKDKFIIKEFENRLKKYKFEDK